MKSLALEHRALSTWTFSLRVWKDWICLENCYTIEIYLHKVQLVYSLHCIHKWRCHTNMSVIETISHSMHFPWRVCASHFISFTCFPKPDNGWDEVSAFWVLYLSPAFKYSFLLIIKEPLYIHLTLTAVPHPQWHFSKELHSLCPFPSSQPL